MNNTELTKNYWNYYLTLEKRFLSTSNYVELDSRNLNTFSNEFAQLLHSVGAELDNFFKVYCGYNLTDRKTIADYAAFIFSSYPEIKEQKMKVIDSDIELQPFKDWDQSQPAQSLSWWKAFDQIKHNRYGNFEKANLDNLINTLSALFLLEMKCFQRFSTKNATGVSTEPDVPSRQSELFVLESWSFQYIPVGKIGAVINDVLTIWS